MCSPPGGFCNGLNTAALISATVAVLYTPLLPSFEEFHCSNSPKKPLEGGMRSVDHGEQGQVLAGEALT